MFCEANEVVLVERGVSTAWGGGGVIEALGSMGAAQLPVALPVNHRLGENSDMVFGFLEAACGSESLRISRSFYLLTTLPASLLSEMCMSMFIWYTCMCNCVACGCLHVEAMRQL